MSVTNDLLQIALEEAGVHSEISMQNLNANQRTIFGLLEAIDFGCFEKNCIRLGETTIDEVQDYIIEHYESIPIPSALGLFAGKFDFLGGKI